MTLMSGKVYSDFGVPSNTIGEQGDIFMQLDGLKITYRKEGVAWTPIGNQLGTIPEFIEGNGLPSNILGEDGQYYRDVTTQAIYQKSAGVWDNIGSWTSIQATQVLNQGGVGKDLGTTPNFITSGSMDNLTTVGEYYVLGVTELPVGVTAGFVKVWRIDANNVGQVLQRVTGASLFSLHIRQSTGGVFPLWRSLADSEGSSSQVFKVANAVADQDATAKLQVETMITNALDTTASPQAYGRFKNVAPYPEIQYFDSTLRTYMATRISSGWQITLFPDLTSADYIVVGSVTDGGGSGGRSFEPYDQTISGFKIKSSWGGDNTTGNSTADGAEVNFVVF